jgi:hypothetical protein
MRSRTVVGAVALLLASGIAGGLALARETKSELKADLRDDQVVGNWIYDDIDAGFAQAVREKKPVCVVFR